MCQDGRFFSKMTNIYWHIVREASFAPNTQIVVVHSRQLFVATNLKTNEINHWISCRSCDVTEHIGEICVAMTKLIDILVFKMMGRDYSKNHLSCSTTVCRFIVCWLSALKTNKVIIFFFFLTRIMMLTLHSFEL